MAAIGYTVQYLQEMTMLATWPALNSTDTTGVPFEAPDYSDMTVQISGTFGAGTLTMQGSNDGTTWFSLTDPQGNAIAKNSAGMECIEEAPRYVRPSLGSANTTDSINVLLKATRGWRRA